MKSVISRILSLTAALAVVLIGAQATAATIPETVKIGSPGNTADTRYELGQNNENWGAVGYEYEIGKYEVTADQFNESGIATPGTSGSQAAAGMNWYDAAEYANWLTTDDKDSGPYDTGQSAWRADQTEQHTYDSISLIDHDPTSAEMSSLISEHGKVYVLPDADEMHKAAYYDQDNDKYWDYANGTDSLAEGDGWNVDDVETSVQDVGYSPEEMNGTHDIMGNVLDMNESPLHYSWTPGWKSGARGGQYAWPVDRSKADDVAGVDLSDGDDSIGFRIAAVPEPGSLALLLLGSLALFHRRRRRNS